MNANLEHKLAGEISQYAGALVRSISERVGEVLYVPMQGTSAASSVSVKHYELTDSEENFLGSLEITARNRDRQTFIEVRYEGVIPGEGEVDLVARNCVGKLKDAPCVYKGRWYRHDHFKHVPLVVLNEIFVEDISSSYGGRGAPGVITVEAGSVRSSDARRVLERLEQQRARNASSGTHRGDSDDTIAVTTGADPLKK